MRARFGRYEAIRAIAAGGMAAVYLGRALGEGGFERLVAIKVMHPHIAAEPDFRAMFLDEARLAARIRHPNVVATLDVQRDDAGLFLVMEFIDGLSLHSLWRAFRAEQKLLPIDIVLRVFIDVLSGLHAAHELAAKDGAPLNLVHRDVSPQNILVGKDGIARITDFGVARAEARIASTQSGQLKGKLPYMPSEQLAHTTLDRRCDVYGAAVALWEALSGSRLFRADNEAALTRMILEGAQRSPREIRHGVPEEIARVCMRALSVERELRPASAAAFADELEDAAEQSHTRVATSRRLASFVAELPKRITEHPSAMGPTPPTNRLDSDVLAMTDASAEVPVAAVRHDSDATRLTAGTRARRRGRQALLLAGTLLVGLGLGAAFVGLSGTMPSSATGLEPRAAEADAALEDAAEADAALEDAALEDAVVATIAQSAATKPLAPAPGAAIDADSDAEQASGAAAASGGPAASAKELVAEKRRSKSVRSRRSKRRTSKARTRSRTKKTSRPTRSKAATPPKKAGPGYRPSEL